ncbi:MAG: hypothetical protein MJ211_07595 [Bacteroidales bacterium]|nr:hypothetical protein [Bacteroidales bacterium]
MDSLFSWIDLNNILVFNPSRPLLFTQFYFWGFFVFVMSIYVFIYKKIALRNVYLFLVSVFFYYKTGGIYVILLIFTIVSIFYITKWLHKKPDGVAKKLILALGVVVNLFILFYFKYTEFILNSVNDIFSTNFTITNYYSIILTFLGSLYIVKSDLWIPITISLISIIVFIKRILKANSQNDKNQSTILFITLNIVSWALFVFTEPLVSLFGLTEDASFFSTFLGENFVTDKIILPVGISFFTFQSISYCVDVYRKQIEPVESVIDFGFYVSFFPQLVAGPIVRASEFIPQIYKEYSLTKQEFGLALFMILKGLIKKVFISDYISINFIDRVFDSPLKYSGYETLMSLYGYSMQVYADFSGYTDIAIGLALLMGFKLSMNFNSPYKAKSTAEFWRRWHISLSTWLKDYLYIPIGGNRNGSLGGYICWIVIITVWVMLSGSMILAIILYGSFAILMTIAHFFPDFKLTLVTSMNNLITMLLGGLWHGSSWMFVIWGGYNGLGLVVYKLWRKEQQILRWIILAVLNIGAFITYHFNIWHNDNGILLWIIANCVWFFCYFVWKLKLSKVKFFKLSSYILSTIIIAFFILCIDVISGFWFTEYKYIFWIGFTLLAMGAFYYANLKSLPYCEERPVKDDSKIEKVKSKINLFPEKTFQTILVWLNFIVSATCCYIGYTSALNIIWLTISSIILASYLFMIVKPQIKEPSKFLAYFWGIFLTFNFITFTRIWFRAQDIETTGYILERLLNGWSDLSLIPQMTMAYKKVFIVMAFGFVIHWLSVPFKEKYTNWFVNSPIWIKVLICVVTVFILYQVKASDLQPFIYFQF